MADYPTGYADSGQYPTGVSSGIDPRLALRFRLAQQLAGQGLSAAPARTPIEGLGRLASGLAGLYMGDKVSGEIAQRSDDKRDTLARALTAGQGGGSTFDPNTNAWSDNAKADPQLMNTVLSSNRDTAPMAMQNMLENVRAERGFGQQKALQESSQGQQQRMQESSQQFTERMAKENQAFQRTMGTPIMIPDGTSPTGFKYVRPEEAVGHPAYNPNAMFGPPGAVGTGSASGAPQVTGDDFLKTLSPQAADTVKGIAEGRVPISPQMVRTPQGMQLLGAVNQYDPTFDATNYQARQNQRKNYEGGGKQFQELQAITTVAGHLNDFKDAADDLKNTAFPMWNSVANTVAQATGDPRVDRFNTVRQAVSNELSKAYRGGQVTEGDVKDWQKNISDAKSPEQMKAVIGQLNDLLASKRNAIEEGYKQTMGKTVMPAQFSATNERTKAIFDGISKWSNGEKPSGGPAGATGGWSIQRVD